MFTDFPDPKVQELLEELMRTTTASNQREAVERAIKLWLCLDNPEQILARNGEISSEEVDMRWA